LRTVLELDDVVAELGLDRASDSSSFLSAEGGVGEFLHHVGLLEPAEIAAFRAGSLVGRLLLGELVEGRTLLDLGDQRLGLVLGRTRMCRACTSSSVGIDFRRSS
jgi:hypothetical protein